MNKSYIKIFPNSLIFQYAILFIIAVVIWQFFYPGLMSPDSLAQYEQAKAGRYDDWHPPIMSIFLSLLMLFGGNIGLMTLLQCLAALFGLRNLFIRLIQFFSKGEISLEKSQLSATFLTLIFLLPFLTPFMFFSVIYWKDAWLAIISLWVISYALWIYEKANIIVKKDYLKHLIWLSIFSSILVLIRHNALVILPFLSILIGFLSKSKLGKKWFSLAAFQFLLAITLNPLINFVFDVGKTHTGNTVLASDLAVFLKLYPELDAEYPLTARHKDAPTVLLTDDGGVWNETTIGIPCPYMNKKICDSEMPLACFGNKENTLNIEGNDCYMPVGNDNKVLKDEYFKAVSTQPFKLLNAKIYLFWQMLHPRYWESIAVNCEISSNPMGLKLSDNFISARETLCYLNHQTSNKRYFKWFSKIHLLWFLINILFVFVFSVKKLIFREANVTFSILLFLTPLSYYLSYILAATTPDYRFMYPSTLLMQVITVSLIISFIPNLYKKYKNFELSKLIGEDDSLQEVEKIFETDKNPIDLERENEILKERIKELEAKLK